MFSNNAGFCFEGGTFYNVSGDVNLQNHEHLTSQHTLYSGDQRAHEGSIFVGEEKHGQGWGEGSGRELPGDVRTKRRTGRLPYDRASRPRPLADKSSDIADPPRPFSFRQSVPRSPPQPSASLLSVSPTEPPVPELQPSFHDISDDGPDSSHLRRKSHPAPLHISHSDHLAVAPRPILGGTFITAESVNQNHHHGESGLIVLHRAVALEALYDSAESFPQLRCHPDTRAKILDDLYGWATEETSTTRRINWLHGPAGAGKSAIMQELSQRLKAAGYLGGSFFFKRGHRTRGNAKVLFATLAYQLAIHIRKLKSLISKVVEDDPSVVARRMEDQLHELIVRPCQCLEDYPALIVLIDGLDECDDHVAQLEILRVLGNVGQSQSLRFKFLIASRPESHIREKFEDPSFYGLYVHLNMERSFDDVRKYLRDEFSRIHREHRNTMQDTPTPWPPNDILEALVEKSSGHFIYPATVIKFVDDKNFRPTERLEVIQNFVPNNFDSSFEALDHLYTQILSEVPAQSCTKLCDILCVVANLRLTPAEIDQLLDLKDGDVLLTLRSLHSVLKISENSAILAHHASFLDFLNDFARASIFHIGSHHHTRLASSILRVFSYDNRKHIGPLVAWEGLRSQWCKYITSLPPAAELVPLIRFLNPDFLWWHSITAEFRRQTEDFLEWLKAIQPPPEDLIQRWKDYRFLCYAEISWTKRQEKMVARSMWVTDREVLSPSPEILETIAGHEPGLYGICHRILSQNPQLLRILQARRLLDAKRSFQTPFSCGLVHIRILLDLSWDDIRDAICALRSIVNGSYRKISTTLTVLSTLCCVVDSGALTSKDLALGFIGLIQRIGSGTLPLSFWTRFGILSPRGALLFPEWGRHVRSSPPSSPELLNDLRKFDPPWNMFNDYLNSGLLCPIDFHDVIQWLQTLRDPPLDIIERWRSYLSESRDRFPVKYTDPELEERWQINLATEAYLRNPPRLSNERVIQRWNSEFGLGHDISDLEEDKDDGIDGSTEASEEHRFQGRIRVREAIERKTRSQKPTSSVTKQTAAKESKQRSKRMKTVKSKDKKRVNAANGASTAA